MANDLRFRATLQDDVGRGLAKINAEVKGAGSAFGSFGSSAEKNLGRVGGALGHAKGQVLGLTSSMGPLIGVAGFTGLTAVIGSSIGKATEFGVTVSKVGSLTGLAADKSSALSDTLDKYGIAGNRQVTLFGKQEKGLATLIGTTGKGKDAISKAAQFEKDFGLSVVDANGKLVDANTLLLRSADYFNGSATATQKAAALSKLYGKTWTEIIPLLQLGSEGIKKEETAAIHLTDTQLANISKFKEAQRNFADTVGDLQVKIGAELMPTITGALKTVGAWLDTHSDDVVEFFREATDFGGKLASGAAAAFGAIKAGWDLIPGPLKTLLIGGFAAGKVTKWVFGVDITASIGKAISGVVVGAIGKSVGSAVVAAGIGKAFVQPVFVTNQGFGGAGGLAGAAAGAGEGAAALGAGAGVASLTTVLAIAAIPAALAVWAGLSGPKSEFNDKGVQTAGMALRPEGLLGIDVTKMPRGGPKGQSPQNQAAIAAASAAIIANAIPASQRNPDRFDRAMFDAVRTGAEAGTKAGIIHSPLFAKARAIREAAGATLSLDVLRGGAGFGKFAGRVGAADVETSAEAVALAQTSRLGTDPSQASLRSAVYNLSIIKADQKRLPTDLASKLTPRIRALEDAINRTTAAIKAKQFTVKAYLGPGQKGISHAKGSGPTEFATGAIGMTRGRTDMIVGEAGGEMVAVLRNPRQAQTGGGSEVTINLNVHSTRGVITPGVARDIMRELGPLLTLWMQRQGILPRVGTALRG